MEPRSSDPSSGRERRRLRPRQLQPTDRCDQSRGSPSSQGHGSRGKACHERRRTGRPQGDLHGHRSDQGRGRRAHDRGLGSGLQRRRARRGGARVLRSGRRRERLALRTISRGAATARTIVKTPTWIAGLHGARAGITMQAVPAARHAQLCRRLGRIGRGLDRSRPSRPARPTDVRPGRLLHRCAGDRRVQPRGARCAPTEVLRPSGRGRPRRLAGGPGGGARGPRARRVRTPECRRRWMGSGGSSWPRRRGPTASARTSTDRPSPSTTPNHRAGRRPG